MKRTILSLSLGLFVISVAAIILFWQLRVVQGELHALKKRNAWQCSLLQEDLADFKRRIERGDASKHFGHNFVMQALDHCLPSSSERDAMERHLAEVQNALVDSDDTKAMARVDELIELLDKHANWKDYVGDEQ